MLLATDYTAGLSTALSNVLTFLPKLVAFVFIVIIGYIVAKVISKILAKVLQKVGFDRVVERGGLKKALEKSSYDAASILGKLLFYTIMLFVLSTAFGVFGTNPISGYLKAIIAYLPLVFVAIVIVAISAAIAAGAKALVQNSLGGLSYGNTLAGAISALILGFGVVAALDQLHIAQNVVNALLYASLTAVVGVIIVAVGGGGIKTMSSRWEAMAATYDEEKVQLQQQLQAAPGIRQQAARTKDKARSGLDEEPGARPLRGRR